MISGVQQYTNPDVLVETERVEKNRNDTNLRIVEVDYDRTANYDTGHIPGAVLIDWKKELEELYVPKGITPDKEVITYCRIGERLSHTWFVLKYLLGYRNVKNYDGSWSEWGNSVQAPVEK